MRIEEFCLEAADGWRLAATIYEPGMGNGIALQINPATAVPRRYYDSFAQFMATRGFAVLTYDYRGIAGSRAGRQRDAGARMRHWGALDQAAASRFLRRRFPNRALAIVGHSAGGQMLGLNPLAGEVAAGLLVGAQNGYWGNWPAPQRYRMAVLWYLMLPVTVRLFGHLPGRLLGGEALPRSVALDWAAWCRQPHYLSDESGRALRPFNDELRCPLRIVDISDDWMAPRKAVDALGDFYPRARVERVSWRPEDFGQDRLGHFGWFRPSMPRDAWAEAAEWLERAVGAQPRAAMPMRSAMSSAVAL
ncbi:MAG: alpha/beta hydrolase [Alphaproteobacteria bacterium]|nr:alpha/beta hydrolase [Alphaproteobacteria bacterium]